MSAPMEQAPNGQAPVAAPAAAPAAANGTGPINDRDVEDWKNRFNHVLGNAGETVNSKSAADAQPWTNSFFGCCSPIDTCMEFNRIE